MRVDIKAIIPVIDNNGPRPMIKMDKVVINRDQLSEFRKQKRDELRGEVDGLSDVDFVYREKHE